MSDLTSAATIADFRTLNEAEVLSGYLVGFEGQPVPASDSSRSFYHGWRNGRVDAGYCCADFAQIALVEEFRALRSPMSLAST